MKYFLFLLISFSAFAAPEFFPVGKIGGASYTNKDFCESYEGQACYNITKCPLDVCELYNVLEDGVEKVVLAENPVKVAASNSEATDKKDACDNLKLLGDALDNIKANITSEEAGNLNQLRQAQNDKNQSIADALKIIKRCLK
jgi:hypothetical protein